MRTTTDIVFGVSGQSLAHRVLAGRPTSATFAVLDDDVGDDDAKEFSGTATVDAVNTAVNLASGPSQADSTRINLASTAGIVTSRKYLLSENAKQEWVQPVEVVAGSHIRVRHPLRNDYTTAATLVGATVTAAVDATWVLDLSKLSDHIDHNPSYRVRWNVVVNGETKIEYSFFDLVRATVTHRIDIDDLNSRAPGLYDSMPTEYQVEQARPVIEAAWQSVQARLAALDIDTDAFRDNQVLDELVILRALNLIARGGWMPGAFSSVTDYIAATQAEYDAFIEQHLQAVNKHKMDAGTNGAAAPVAATSYWSK